MCSHPWPPPLNNAWSSQIRILNPGTITSCRVRTPVTARKGITRAALSKRAKTTANKGDGRTCFLSVATFVKWSLEGGPCAYKAFRTGRTNQPLPSSHPPPSAAPSRAKEKEYADGLTRVAHWKGAQCPQLRFADWAAPAWLQEGAANHYRDPH